jgi:hypothetical protein
MPSYFCTKCHKLTIIDLRTSPDTFVCEECKKEKSATVKEVAHETADEKECVICGISDWKQKGQ